MVSKYEDPFRQGRVRRYMFPPRLLIAFFNMWVKPEAIRLICPEMECIPEDAYVVAVEFDHARNALSVQIASEEFDVVPPCEVIPVIYTLFDVGFVPVQEPEQKLLAAPDSSD